MEKGDERESRIGDRECRLVVGMCICRVCEATVSNADTRVAMMRGQVWSGDVKDRVMIVARREGAETATEAARR